VNFGWRNDEMTSVALAAEIRSEKGKSGVNKVRARGLCPAVVYGPGVESLHVSTVQSFLSWSLPPARTR
jgi:ribosomal protein L25 (general stress protein Ctc)